MYSVILFIYIVICIVLLILWVGLFTRIPIAHKTSDIKRKHSATSIIIASRNEYQNFKTSLPKILSQLDSNSELIVVDNHSNENDSISRLLKEDHKLSEHSNFHVIFRGENDAKGKKSALTAGIRAAKFENMLLTDADCKVGPNWVGKMTKQLAENDVCLGYGGYDSSSGWLNALIRFETLLTAGQYMSMAIIGQPYMGVGRNLAYRKTVFQKIDGFSNHLDILSGDDDLFIQEAAATHNIGICTDPETFTYSAPPKDLKSFFRQKRRHLSTSTSYKMGHQLWLGAIGFSNLLFYPFMIILLISQPSINLIMLSTFIILIKWIIFARLSRIFEAGTLVYRFIVLDLLFCIYLWVLVPLLFMNRPSKWN